MIYPEAQIALCKCREVHKTYGVRFEKSGKEWKATWAFPIKKEGMAEREKYDKTLLKGQIVWDFDYPGCPYCGGRSFIICDCGGLHCKVNPKQKEFTCEWCGVQGVLVDYSGEGINAGGDR